MLLAVKNGLSQLSINTYWVNTMYVGVDLGTSSIKLLLVTSSGTIVRTVSEPLDIIIPQSSWSEQNPLDWKMAFDNGFSKLIDGYENQIRGLSFSGQMHGLVLLDESDQVIRNALLWNDQRTTNEVEMLNRDFGVDRLLEYTGNIALTGLTAPKLLWIKHHEPENFARINKVMLPKDYLAYYLTGVFASDVTDLSGTLFFNPQTKTYCDEILSYIGITKKQLPSIHESYEVVGTIKPERMIQYKLNQEVSVVIGGGDQAVGAIGAGIDKNGECSISLGTSGVIFVSSDEFIQDPISHFQSYAHANGRYHLMAVMLNAAGAIKWWNESILKSTDYTRFYQDVYHSSMNESLFFLPYLTGERAPINDPLAQGVLYGLRLHHTQNDINRAIVEGVCFALKESFDRLCNLGLSISSIRLIGGGAKSKVWTQMLADVLNVEIMKINSEEGPALGAAILAMVGCLIYENVSEAIKTLVNVVEVIHPNTLANSHYNHKYQTYKELYPSLKALFQKQCD